MKYPLFSEMALTSDLPDHGLRRGDVVRLVDHHIALGGGEGYSVEVCNAVGDTIIVTTVDASSLEPLQSDEVFSIRHRRSAVA